MALSKEEQAQLDALTKKSKEPDGPPANINFNLDLSSDAAWERAKKLGLFKDPDDDKPNDGEDDDNKDEPPKRKGFFGE